MNFEEEQYTFDMSDEVKTHVENKLIVPTKYCLSSPSYVITMDDLQSKEMVHPILARSMWRLYKYLTRGFRFKLVP